MWAVSAAWTMASICTLIAGSSVVMVPGVLDLARPALASALELPLVFTIRSRAGCGC
ncbi:hypothetical protein PF005_g20642 [Phytophthora fragariae]|uniref:Uncharacterized protein n=1 Tax=Phytophthora fragariae TaxID=53985 RepID=A0A6A3WLA2_9STRA|nr:hypothetical protein PF003_g31035 [Phytophthora fragariae]KAE8924161.1 hypothetical protein PF009_g25608 [Phytophthora fragariae]KAE9073774.1 hypothetical protein PF007_g25678 [Phytophthora fragariae]KAE9143926.1 hypothetical protein PF006_g11098 [Phytophthora fragariae]KAE9186964.1 hypothetical protein PF005_g20642 [Phytophthora fragariae]